MGKIICSNKTRAKLCTNYHFKLLHYGSTRNVFSEVNSLQSYQTDLNIMSNDNILLKSKYKKPTEAFAQNETKNCFAGWYERADKDQPVFSLHPFRKFFLSFLKNKTAYNILQDEFLSPILI